MIKNDNELERICSDISEYLMLEAEFNMSEIVKRRNKDGKIYRILITVFNGEEKRQ